MRSELLDIPQEKVLVFELAGSPHLAGQGCSDDDTHISPLGHNIILPEG
jgi:hypothetical protein